MRHLLFLLLCIPSILFAQDNSKYLVGAVPEVNGKVIFSKIISNPAYTKDQMYATLLQWAEKQFIVDSEQQGRVIFKDAKEGILACSGDQNIVFKRATLSLDRARMHYKLKIFCEDGKAILDIENIRYIYNVSYQDAPEKYLAETWITDENALNKSKTKMIKSIGKFRIKTIDLVDELFASATAAVGATVAPQQQIAATKIQATATPIATQATVVAAIPAVATHTPTLQNELSGYKRIDANKIPGNIIKMLTEDWMLITAGNTEKFNMMTANWGGLGSMFGKPVAFCFIDPTRHTFELMENNDTYTLTFYSEAHREALNFCGSKSGKSVDKVAETGLTPITTGTGSKAFSEAWLVIECKKMISQTITPEAISDPEVKKAWSGKQLRKMFVGEIINVWVK